MWQRFTERARRVVFFAQEEAVRLGENSVGTEHLLLGLVREDDSVAARILDRLGVPLGRIRSDIERQVTRGHGNVGQDMQLTPRGKRVIDLAYGEARRAVLRATARSLSPTSGLFWVAVRLEPAAPSHRHMEQMRRSPTRRIYSVSYSLPHSPQRSYWLAIDAPPSSD